MPDSTLKMPKAYLSYSQMRVWLDDKNQYRDRYYRGIQEPSSKYMMFGSEIAKGLEDGSIVVPGLIQYPVKEYQCKIDVDGVPFFAYLDTYWPERFKFREYKTGSPRSDGRPRWTQKDVQAHMQLDIYSLLIQIKDGAVDDECHLDWIKTRPKMKYLTDNWGNILESQSNEMELTGELQSFTRVITQHERDRMRSLIRSVANEISEDYVEFLRVAALRAPALPLIL